MHADDGPHTLRPTTPSDIPTLHRLMRDFATYEKLDHRFKITEAELHAVLFGPNPAIDSILAEVNGTTVGFALWYFLFGTFSGHYAPVRGGHLRRAAPTAAAASASRCSATWRASRLSASCADMEWNVLDWNTPAIEFYRRIGAKPRRAGSPSNLTGDALIALAKGAENA